jgi:hypothetical protein
LRSPGGEPGFDDPFGFAPTEPDPHGSRQHLVSDDCVSSACCQSAAIVHQARTRLTNSSPSPLPHAHRAGGSAWPIQSLP